MAHLPFTFAEHSVGMRNPEYNGINLPKPHNAVGSTTYEIYRAYFSLSLSLSLVLYIFYIIQRRGSGVHTCMNMYNLMYTMLMYDDNR